MLAAPCTGVTNESEYVPHNARADKIKGGSELEYPPPWFFAINMKAPCQSANGGWRDLLTYVQLHTFYSRGTTNAVELTRTFIIFYDPVFYFNV